MDAGASRDDSEDAHKAVLEILRGCCADSLIVQYGEILRVAPPVAQGMHNGHSLVDAVEDAIADAVSALPGAERQAVRVMAGMEPGWERSRLVGREARKIQMGIILGRTSDPADGGLTSRRVEQMEVEDLAPAVTRLLFTPRLRRRPTLRDRPIFAQIVNPEFLELHHQGDLLKNPQSIRSRLEYVTRMALLTSRIGLVMPASYIFEVPGVADFLTSAHEITEAGVVQLSAPALGLAEYREIKLPEYRDEIVNPYSATEPATLLHNVTWRPRRGSSAGHSIADAWPQHVRPGAALARVVDGIVKTNDVTYRVAARRLAGVPQRLDGRALVARYVIDVLDVRLGPSDRYAIGWLLSSKYMESYAEDLDAAVLVEFSFGSFDPFGGALKERLISALRIKRVLRILGVEQPALVRPVDWRLILTLRENEEFDLLLSALYEDNSADGYWLKVSAFRRRSPPPDAQKDPTGYIIWLGYLADAVS